MLMLVGVADSNNGTTLRTVALNIPHSLMPMTRSLAPCSRAQKSRNAVVGNGSDAGGEVDLSEGVGVTSDVDTF